MLDLLDRDLGYEKGQAMTKDFFSQVFAYMFGALGLTALVAYYVGVVDQSILFELINPQTGSFTMFGYIVLFAPIGIVLFMQMRMAKLSMPVLIGLFVAYSVLLGLSLSFIFLAYSMGTLFKVFMVTSLTYGVVAVLGYTTKTDLTKFGSIMYILFIGIFIASMINIFMQSSGLDWIISIIGVVVFTGLTAYKMQELKYMSSNPEFSGADRSKLALIGGLQLYILFINLFLSLLRLMGDE